MNMGMFQKLQLYYQQQKKSKTKGSILELNFPYLKQKSLKIVICVLTTRLPPCQLRIKTNSVSHLWNLIRGCGYNFFRLVLISKLQPEADIASTCCLVVLRQITPVVKTSSPAICSFSGPDSFVTRKILELSIIHSGLGCSVKSKQVFFGIWIFIKLLSSCLSYYYVNKIKRDLCINNLLFHILIFTPVVFK